MRALRNHHLLQPHLVRSMVEASRSHKPCRRAWGVRHIPDDGKVVWAELPNSHPAGSPTPPASR